MEIQQESYDSCWKLLGCFMNRPTVLESVAQRSEADKILSAFPVPCQARFFGFCLFLEHVCQKVPAINPKNGPLFRPRIDKNRGLAKVGLTKIGVWRKSARRFPYFFEARIDVFPTFLQLGSIISKFFCFVRLSGAR